MNDTFERIALELRNRCSIGYRPANFTADGKWRKIKVKVQPPRGLPRLVRAQQRRLLRAHQSALMVTDC